MKVPKNHALVLIPSRWKEYYETESGFKLLRETHHHERRYENSETSGRVVAMFAGLSNRVGQPTRCQNPKVSSDRMAHLPTENTMMPYTALEGTFAGLKAGEMIHFSYEALLEEENVLDNRDSKPVMMLSSYPQFAPDIENPSGWEIVPVLADGILAIERNGELIAVGGKALIEPIEQEEMEKLSDVIHIPDGFKVKKLKNAGRLISASAPMKGLYGIEAKPGDMVWYDRSIAEYFEWNGKKIEWVYLTEIHAYAEA